MRLELPCECERFGAVVFHGSQRLHELDSGLHAEEEGDGRSLVAVPYGDLYDIERRTAIVVPIRGERLRLLEGVLYAIPNQCLVIVVSASSRSPVDRFRMEGHAVESISRFARKRIILVHQKDRTLGRAFAEAGYHELLDGEGTVRDGKGEGMLIGTVLAHLAGKRHVGFVDSDNYFPGSVHEYVRAYSAAFALARSDYSMVRILWHSKPKVVDSRLYFSKWGRSSRVTNRFLNELIAHYTGFETDVIRTGNAGEHALTLPLALRLDYSPGYTIEPHHFVSLLEGFGGVRESPFPEVMREQVEVFQIESRNPHYHESGEEDHVRRMRAGSLGVIHDSPICPDHLRRRIEEEVRRDGSLEHGEVPAPDRYYPPPMTIDFDAFRSVVENEPYAPLLRDGREPKPTARTRPPYWRSRITPTRRHDG